MVMSGMTGRPVRKPTRIPGYDYATAGMYFMTMCVQHRESRFGTFEHSAVCLNAAGEMVARVWQENIERYPGAALDLFVVMPDHMHAIVFAGTDPSTSGERVSLLRIVQSFKSLTTVEYAREVTKGIFPSYDRILRNQRELDGARAYIEGNPGHAQEQRDLTADAPISQSQGRTLCPPVGSGCGRGRANADGVWRRGGHKVLPLVRVPPRR